MLDLFFMSFFTKEFLQTRKEEEEKFYNLY